MKPGERIPLHDHGDSNSGGTLAAHSTMATAAAGSSAASSASSGIEVAEDGTAVLVGATGIDATHGLDAADEGTGLVSLAVDESEFTYGGTGDMTAEAIGSTVSAGASHKPADAAHRHAMPSAAAPSGGYGTAAAGSAATILLSDAVLSKPTAADVDFSSDVTTSDATSGHHGLLPKLAGGTTKFLREDGTWQLVGSSSSTTFRGCSLSHSTTVSAAVSGTHYAMLMDTEQYDTDGFHFTSNANLTGTVAKTSGNVTIVGTGSSFTTELSVNQVVEIPGGTTEIFVVKTITDNTHIDVWVAPTQTSSGQTAVRRNRYIGIPSGLGGYYFLAASTQWAANATGSRTVAFGKNQIESAGNFNMLGAQRLMAANNSSTVIVGAWSPPTSLNAGDFVYAGARQDSGGALNFGDAGGGVDWLVSQFSVTRQG